ncbi:hydrogenase maturation nickel metallochaperone HypA [Cyanobium sp. FGCU-6]|jgi:hydrogenase nickel incorporation protein HypA/HybF|nr:hydrogenase maturation nickel metallochaperone HypA [Cyanobium sp. FGCU6]
MHEVDMTRCLLLSMGEWKQQHAPRQPRVSTVHLQVGAFTCVEPDQLVFTWEAAVQGSWLAGARLAIEPVPLLGRCVLCSSTYAPLQEQGYRSPCCNHPMEEIVSGRELRIRSVEYALDDPPANASLPSSSTSTCVPCA